MANSKFVTGLSIIACINIVPTRSVSYKEKRGRNVTTTALEDTGFLVQKCPTSKICVLLVNLEIVCSLLMRHTGPKPTEAGGVKENNNSRNKNS
jgi:hypothetical protein